MADVRVAFSAEGANVVVSDAEKIQRSLEGVSGSQSGLASGSEGMSSSMVNSFKFISASAILDIGTKVVDALAQAGQAIIEFSQEGAQLLRVEEAGTSLARSMGVSMTAIMASVKSASLGMISDADLMLSANRALMLGVTDDAETMGKLMEVAAVRGRAMGLSTSKAFDDIVTGIGRASPQILDNLGIITDANTTYANYAASIGKAANELSKAEKQQALLNRVLADTAPLLAANGLQMDTAGKWEAMQAAQTNYFDNMKKDLADSTSWWADFWAAVFNEANALTAYQDLEGQLKQLGIWTDEMTAFREASKTTTSAIGGGKAYEGFFWNADADIAFVDKFLPTLIKYEEGVIKAEQAQAKWNEKNNEGAQLLDVVAFSQKQATETTEELNKEMERMIKVQAELANVASLTANFKGMIGLAEKFDDVLEKIVEQETIMANNPIGSKKYEEAKEKLDALKQTMTELANQVVLDMFQATIAIGGVTEAEADAYFDLAKDMGVISGEAAEKAKQVYGDAIAYINGLSIDDKTGNLTVNVRYNDPGYGGSTVSYGSSGTGKDIVKGQFQALGGPVYPDKSYIVGERGVELFVPDVQGHIVPDYMLGGSSNASFDIDYTRLARAISDSIVEASEQGRIGNNIVIDNQGNQVEMSLIDESRIANLFGRMT